MTLKAMPALAMITIIGLGVQVEARTPCQEYLRLRNAATEAWKQAMRAPPSERCGALYRASLAAETTLPRRQITIAVTAKFLSNC